MGIEATSLLCTTFSSSSLVLSVVCITVQSQILHIHILSNSLTLSKRTVFDCICNSYDLNLFSDFFIWPFEARIISFNSFWNKILKLGIYNLRQTTVNNFIHNVTSYNKMLTSSLFFMMMITVKNHRLANFFFIMMIKVTCHNKLLAFSSIMMI